MTVQEMVTFERDALNTSFCRITGIIQKGERGMSVSQTQALERARGMVLDAIREIEQAQEPVLVSGDVSRIRGIVAGMS